jgi:RNA-directed DNA polymerase
MKQAGGCFEAIGLRANLAAAYCRARSGKVHTRAVHAFLTDLDANLNRLAHDWQAEQVTFGGYTVLDIYDGKRRRIHAPPFEQRVLHQAMIGVLGPHFLRSALPSSFACRTGLGHAAALTRARAASGRYAWFLKMDVAKFYDQISHLALRAQLQRRFRERRLLRAFERLLESYHTAPGQGLPMGALTSQYLANFHLDPLDHLLVDRLKVPEHIRYMDDMFIWSDDPAELLRVREHTAAWLGERGLRIKQNGVLNRCVLGVPFLGLVVYPNRVRMSQTAKRRLGMHYRTVCRGLKAGRISEPDAQDRLTALFAWARQADDAGWRQALLRRSDFGDVLQQAGDARRQLHEHRSECPFSLPQQEAGG